ncbi:MAG: hypothetical protein DIZ80_10450 [endosymbiont of Galathealinum brachiosum]|uniref:Uncharacterized protein n=1 Tax=endosymbiont of Galathealinum brachiosum TaxID=2200906 RepID=A0A370DCT4_9GAMM|nr:MAG: hypothetical protein DIZ80_10450 [endosymbiont of Galathealinum brachiosum]
MSSRNVVQITDMGIITDEKPPLIKPGVYELAFVEYQTALMFGRASKLIMKFRIVSLGEHFGVELFRYYNIQNFCGKPGRSGKFKAGWKSDFAREYASLFEELPNRTDRFSMSLYKEKIIRGRVTTVKQGSRQRKLHNVCQYSVINELMEVKKL